ncbi:potassium channel subfamily K member 16-like [Acanthaster planci]|uniref:Potassium channel subfamily K member 16-like n=1 Tax=Acanthaster planci TaxID=133434 RepID=A0A8B7ZDQ7_ACAPL|nr:potassium channel subfamily K member 16-like [Acanthaster planci]
MKAWLKSLILIPIFIVYIFLGAYVFHKLEEGNAAAEREEFFKFLIPFAINHSDCLSSDALLSVLDRASEARAKGVMYPSQVLAGQLVGFWSWSNAVVFAATIVTTVGYGRLVPITAVGQIVCIFYAIFGIPLCYKMLSVVGDTFHSLWHHSFRLFDRAAACVKSQRTRKVLGVLVTCLVLWIFLVMIPAVIFANTESWSLVDAQYFSFVSLSTIGFGDIIYGMEDRLATVKQDWLYKIGMLVYFLIGLSVISIVFKGVWRVQKARIKRAQKTTRQFWQNRGGRHRNYSLGTPEAIDEALLANGLFTRKRSGDVVEPVFEKHSAGDDEEIDKTMAMDAMEVRDRKISIISLSYRTVSLRQNLADRDLRHGLCNTSFLEEVHP